AGVLHDVGDPVESTASAVVRIGDVAGVEVHAIAGKQPDLVVGRSGGVERTDVVEVLLVGDEDQVEVVQVACEDLSRTAADLISASGKRFAHAGIRWVPRVVADRSGGIDLDAIFQSG